MNPKRRKLGKSDLEDIKGCLAEAPSKGING